MDKTTVATPDGKKGEPIVVRMQPQVLAVLDAWIAKAALPESADC